LYLSTLRDYVLAMGGVLQIQAVFPEGGAVSITRFGEYEDRSYIVRALTEKRSGTCRLDAEPLDTGLVLSTKVLKAQAFTRTLKALHIPELQISAIRKSLEDAPLTEISGRFAAGSSALPIWWRRALKRRARIRRPTRSAAPFVDRLGERTTSSPHKSADPFAMDIGDESRPRSASCDRRVRECVADERNAPTGRDVEWAGTTGTGGAIQAARTTRNGRRTARILIKNVSGNGINRG
jgi:hypothetical protein